LHFNKVVHQPEDRVLGCIEWDSEIAVGLGHGLEYFGLHTALASITAEKERLLPRETG